MKRKLQKPFNGSVKVALPKEYLRLLDLEGGDEVFISLVDGKIVISKEEK